MVQNTLFKSNRIPKSLSGAMRLHRTEGINIKNCTFTENSAGWVGKIKKKNNYNYYYYTTTVIIIIFN